MTAVPTNGAAQQLDQLRRVLADGGDDAAVQAALDRLSATLDAEHELRDRQTAENARLVGSLGERQRLLERLSKIQSSIVSRRGLQEVLDAIVAGAHELLGDETVGLRLIDPEDRDQLIMVASAGVKPEIVKKMRRSPLGLGAGGQAAATGELVVIEDYDGDEQNLPAFAADGIRAALAMPVHEHGDVVGSIVVATHKAGRTYSQVEREMLSAFAEHASLALTDAKTVADALHQALHDSLTALPNRQLLIDRLEHAQARAARAGTRVAVLFVDLDTFKDVNDTFGHAAGDVLLREAARRLLACIRAADTAARFGGDEFVVLLEDADSPRVSQIANRILEAMSEPFEIEGRELYIGASIGIAVGGANAAEDLLRNADLALYRAKTKGRGQKQVFEPQMHTAMVERIELEGALATALREHELVLHYQPIFELATELLVGVEALIRWEHPVRGLLLPGEFIPVVEDTRLMAPVGRWVLAEACAQASHWLDEYEFGGELTMAVNFSSAQFGDAAMVDDVARIVGDAGIDPERLVIELTETAFLRDADLVTERMRELKQLGIRLAVDDFGTGNASLRHLASFPVDVLKVDRSFVGRIGFDHRQSAIASSIIGLGEDLGLTVIAEGIETDDQTARLLALGCRFGQGFRLARPVAPDALRPMLARTQSVPSERGLTLERTRLPLSSQRR
jgi:diguanylate cyclase (GGDEF)-like protein